MEIYLTEAGPIYQGRAMLVYLWDTGQDMENLQVIDPSGEPIDFTWTTSDGDYGEANPAERCGGEPCLFTDPTRKDYPPPIEGPGWNPSPKFSGRIVILSIDFDERIDLASYDNHWFRLRFNPQSELRPDDYLSVAVGAVGDPIALVD